MGAGASRMKLEAQIIRSSESQDDKNRAKTRADEMRGKQEMIVESSVGELRFTCGAAEAEHVQDRILALRNKRDHHNLVKLVHNKTEKDWTKAYVKVNTNRSFPFCI